MWLNSGDPPPALCHQKTEQRCARHYPITLKSEPYYQAGYSAGRDHRYHGRRFEDIEHDLRSTYHTDHNDRWEDLRGAVHEGFRRARS